MGRDKALIELDGQPLWRLQLAKLRAVCEDVTVCGSRAQSALFKSEPVRFAADATADLGPLSGIARAMESAFCPRVLILAVDVPRISVRYLQGLCEFAKQHGGAVPQRGERFEGLCAVYPVELLPWVTSLLSGSERSIQALIRCGLEERLLHPLPVSDSEVEMFENWNTPEDIPRVAPQAPTDQLPPVGSDPPCDGSSLHDDSPPGATF
jgi:molybdopterin-guanine dinucleotide biosynthesis protein A